MLYCPTTACEPSGVFTISDAVTIRLLLTDEGHLPSRAGLGVPPVGGVRYDKREITHFTQCKVSVLIQAFRKPEMWLTYNKHEGSVTQSL